MSNFVYDIYTIKQIGNGYLLTINEDKVTETYDVEYTDALSRLVTHLTNKVAELYKTEEK